MCMFLIMCSVSEYLLILKNSKPDWFNHMHNILQAKFYIKYCLECPYVLNELSNI